MIKKIVFTFLGLIPFIGNAQNADVFDFQIEGKINMDTGTVNIEMDENKALYPNDFQNFVVKIKASGNRSQRPFKSFKALSLWLLNGHRARQSRKSSVVIFRNNNLPTFIRRQAGTRRDQTTHDDVLFQSTQTVCA